MLGHVPIKTWSSYVNELSSRRAGTTRGAIHGNFKHREDLFLAVVRTH
jgi:hypothetical protein